jgi:hypothetical protein
MVLERLPFIVAAAEYDDDMTLLSNTAVNPAVEMDRVHAHL